jgi:YD repeat-containing protein
MLPRNLALTTIATGGYCCVGVTDVTGSPQPFGCLYAYDANGNTLSDAQGRSFIWDFENRLTQVVNPGVGTTTFRYDPFGRRIQLSAVGCQLSAVGRQLKTRAVIQDRQ